MPTLTGIEVITYTLIGQLFSHKDVEYCTASKVNIQTNDLTHMDINGECIKYKDLNIEVMPEVIE